MQRIESWHDFLVAEVGASAGLAGLLFVAISINIQQILKFRHLPTRAAHTLMLLIGALLAASIALIPASPYSIGVALAVVTISIWLLSLVYIWRYAAISAAERVSGEFVQPHWYVVSFAASSQLAALPLAIGGVLAPFAAPAALYWIAAGILLAFVSAVYNTWVLLVEILR